MLILDATNQSLELQTTSVASTDWIVSWVDITASTFVAGSDEGNIVTATTVTAIPAPAASTQRQVKQVTARNKGTIAQTVTVKKDVGGTEYLATPAVTLAPGEMLQYVDGDGWSVLDAAGRLRTAANPSSGPDGQETAYYKVGTAPEAAGVWYSWAKDTGAPGAWAPGAPGLAGRATDGTTAADAGCIPIKNPTVGANYLRRFQGAASVVCHAALFDVMWVNSGAVVTTTTAQTVNSVALPARDLDGSINGNGVWLGILVTTATTNAAAITNMTASYTNELGVAGRTATVASFPATAVIGTLVWFQLAAGDKGVRSVQTLTLGTSLLTGAVSLFMARPLQSFPCLVANVGGMNYPADEPGVRLYNGTCALPFGLMSAATATTITGFVSVMER